MKEKKKVYNGYEEQYVTGNKLLELFKDKYLTGRRHHSAVLGLSIPDYLLLLGINEENIYRIFINQFFCRVMESDTDHLISFFGYTNLDDVKLSLRPQDIQLYRYCPLCHSTMKFKQGKYGEFLGCSNYPSCKHTTKIPIMGTVISNLEQTIEYWRNYTSKSEKK